MWLSVCSCVPILTRACIDTYTFLLTCVLTHTYICAYTHTAAPAAGAPAAGAGSFGAPQQSAFGAQVAPAAAAGGFGGFGAGITFSLLSLPLIAYNIRQFPGRMLMRAVLGLVLVCLCLCLGLYVCVCEPVFFTVL